MICRGNIARKSDFWCSSCEEELSRSDCGEGVLHATNGSKTHRFVIRLA